MKKLGERQQARKKYTVGVEKDSTYARTDTHTHKEGGDGIQPNSKFVRSKISKKSKRKREDRKEEYKKKKKDTRFSSSYYFYIIFLFLYIYLIICSLFLSYCFCYPIYSLLIFTFKKKKA